MRKVMVIAPHPDDESLGCGGTLLRHRCENDEISWLIVTEMKEALGFSDEQIHRRIKQIDEVSKIYGFNNVYRLSFPTTRLDTIPVAELVKAVSDIFVMAQPQTIYLPYRGDVHTDHRIVFDAVISCTKWFRYPYIKRILAYETLSETNFALNPDYVGFRPNVYVDITEFLNEKLNAMRLYSSELGVFPFPRSEIAITSLAKLRGTAAGCEAAEAFMLIKEIL